MYTWLERLTGVSRSDAHLALPAFAYFFFLLSAYYIVHPLRDEMGLLLGTDYIPTLFRGSMVCVLLANPVFSYLVNRLDRRQFMTVTYRFFAVCTVVFILALKGLEQANLIGAQGEVEVVQGWPRWVLIAFYLWTGIFNLFGFSIFWVLMADVFRSDQGKRLFGFIGAGGTLGQLLGSALADQLVETVGPTNMLWLTVIFLECAVRAIHLLIERADVEVAQTKEEESGKADVWTGVRDTLRSPYLATICLFILLKTFTASILYFEKQNLVESLIADREGRVGYFSKINLAIAGISLVSQLFITGRVLPLVGITFMLVLIPALSLVGFLALHLQPTLVVVGAFELARKAGSFSFARPAREVLFTVVSRRQKYLAKGFIDTFVHRFGDVTASYAVGSFGFGALAALPVTGIWLGVAFLLGKLQRQRENRES